MHWIIPNRIAKTKPTQQARMHRISPYFADRTFTGSPSAAELHRRPGVSTPSFRSRISISRSPDHLWIDGDRLRHHPIQTPISAGPSTCLYTNFCSLFWFLGTKERSLSMFLSRALEEKLDNLSVSTCTFFFFTMARYLLKLLCSSMFFKDTGMVEY
jgi:hypothetical protein